VVVQPLVVSYVSSGQHACIASSRGVNNERYLRIFD